MTGNESEGLSGVSAILALGTVHAVDLLSPQQREALAEEMGLKAHELSALLRRCGALREEILKNAASPPVEHARWLAELTESELQRAPRHEVAALAEAVGVTPPQDDGDWLRLAELRMQLEIQGEDSERAWAIDALAAAAFKAGTRFPWMFRSEESRCFPQAGVVPTVHGAARWSVEVGGLHLTWWRSGEAAPWLSASPRGVGGDPALAAWAAQEHAEWTTLLGPEIQAAG